MQRDAFFKKRAEVFGRAKDKLSAGFVGKSERKRFERATRDIEKAYGVFCFADTNRTGCLDFEEMVTAIRREYTSMNISRQPPHDGPSLGSPRWAHHDFEMMYFPCI